MNAYELADELASIQTYLAGEYGDATDEVTKYEAVNMLRQQADRIAKLEAHLKAEIQADMIENLEKQSEPYAWVNVLPKSQGGEWLSYLKDDEADSHIPLYTTPQTKPLSEEDVKYDVTIKWDDKTTHHPNVSGNSPLHYNQTKPLSDEEINELAENTLANEAIGFVPSWQWIEFARAIEAKVREKNEY